MRHWLLLLGLAEALQRAVRPRDLRAQQRQWPDAAPRALQLAEQLSLEDEPPQGRRAVSRQ